jgi:tRNA pseudouridine32 synthase / 23S rRNA pseudouridine746 synthase
MWKEYIIALLDMRFIIPPQKPCNFNDGSRVKHGMTPAILNMLPPPVLYRDGLMLVIDKPSGIPVHAGPKGGANLEDCFPALQYGLPAPPALAHRLDRDTSGCLILGRQKKGLRRLGMLFQHGGISKQYLAIVEGTPKEPSGTTDAPLMKQSSAKNKWWMKVDPAGQPTITDYTVLSSADGLSLIEFRPRTGRTHQIRVHSAHLGCPLLYDTAYGSEKVGQVFLHAARLEIPLYPNKPSIVVTAPLPSRWRAELPEKILASCPQF